MEKDRLDFENIMEMVAEDFPNAKPEYVKRIISGALRSASKRFPLKRKKIFINVLSGVAEYDVTKHNIERINSVHYANSENDYRAIREVIGNFGFRNKK